MGQDTDNLQLTVSNKIGSKQACLFKSWSMLLNHMTRGGGGLDGRIGTVLSNEQIYRGRDLRSHQRRRRRDCETGRKGREDSCDSALEGNMEMGNTF